MLWAEAYHCYTRGLAWHLSDEIERLAREEQAKRAPEDEGMLYVQEGLDTLHLGKDQISTLDALKLVQAIPGVGKGARYRVKPIMQSLGWIKKQVRDGEKRTWIWAKSANR